MDTGFFGLKSDTASYLMTYFLKTYVCGGKDAFSFFHCCPSN